MSFQSPAPGLVLDCKYRLAERIGGGGMGDVYRAQDVETDEWVAVKILRHELSASSESSRRFFQEARVVARIRHSNIVDVREAGVGEFGPYLVMEYLDGESLADLLHRFGRFGSEEVIALTIPVLHALEATHRARVVHRDLKPENIFLATAGRNGTVAVRLLDFGIAKIVGDAGPARARTGIVFGTPDYLSPEQAEGNARIDGRSDLFALGIVMYELLTGTRPFCGSSPDATAFRVVHSVPASFASLGVNLSPALEAVVFRLLEKDRAKRFATASDVARALEAVLPDADLREVHLKRLLQQSALEKASPRQSTSTLPGFETAVKAGLREVQTRKFGRSADALDATHASRPEVAGVVLRSLDRAIVDTFGESARARIVTEMPEELSLDLRNHSLRDHVGYPVEMANTYAEAALRHLLHDEARFRELGCVAARTCLAPLLSTVTRAAIDRISLLERALPIWMKLFTFGTWSIESDGPLAIAVCGFDPAHTPLRQWLGGVIEETLRHALSCEVRLVEEGEGGSSCRFVVAVVAVAAVMAELGDPIERGGATL